MILKSQQNRIELVTTPVSTKQLYDTASVTIHVLDTNDCPPLFLHSPYTLHLVEGLDQFDSDRPIFTLEATDNDDPPYNEVEYSIRAGGQHDTFFRVNASTGQVFLNQALDRERNEVLDVEFVAMDSGSPRLSSTGTLTVLVQDVNDNVPAFENGIYEFRVPEDAQIGLAVNSILICFLFL